jgi:type II secretory pathway pseudopilin PulG
MVLRRGLAAFTMIEIAIAIGVIGFALVAIIGILPAGLNVQKDASEDTTISQDAPFFLESIRNGGTNAQINNLQTGLLSSMSALDFLTNYVESITIATLNNNGWITNVYTNAVGTAYSMTNGRTILGLLSTAEFYPNARAGNMWVPGSVTNIVTARVRALSGSAVEQNGANSITAFRYLMNVEIAPFSSFAPDSTAFLADQYIYNQFTNYWVDRSNRFLESQYMQFNLFEVRLRFSWPVLPNGTAGANHQSYRTLVAGHLLQATNLNLANPLTTLFQPQWYLNAP